MRLGLRFSALLSIPSIAIMMAACGGSNESPGDKNKDPLKTDVDPKTAKVAGQACRAGFAHPNICCSGGDANQPAACAAYLNAPFHACDSGWTTFPNGEACCSLTDPTNCMQCDESGNCGGTDPTGPGGGSGGGSTCPPPSSCPPGWHGQSPDCATGGCWQYQADPSGGAPNKVGYCEASPSGGGSSGGDPTPIPSMDAGVVDASHPSTDGGSSPAPCEFDACGPTPPSPDPETCGCRPNEPCAGSATCARDPNGQCTWKIKCGPVDPGPPSCQPPCPPGWDPTAPGTCCRTDPTNPNAGVCFAEARPSTRPPSPPSPSPSPSPRP